MSTLFSPALSGAQSSAVEVPFPYAVPTATGYTAGVIQSNGKPFTVGSFRDYKFALQYANEYALDLLCVPHVRANRALKTSDLRAFRCDQLVARRRYLLSGWADKMTRAAIRNECARIVRVQRERLTEANEALARDRALMGGQESDCSDALDNRSTDEIR